MDEGFAQLRVQLQRLETEHARSKRTATIALVVGALGVLSPLLSMSGLLNAKFRKVVAREVDVVDASAKKRIELLASEDGRTDTVTLYGDDVTQATLSVDGSGASMIANDHGGWASFKADRDPVGGAAVRLMSDTTTNIVLNATKNMGGNAALGMFTKNGNTSFGIHDRAENDCHAELAMYVGGTGGVNAQLTVDQYDPSSWLSKLTLHTGGPSEYWANVEVLRDHAEYGLIGSKPTKMFSAMVSDATYPDLFVTKGDDWSWRAKNEAEKPAK